MDAIYYITAVMILLFIIIFAYNRTRERASNKKNTTKEYVLYYADWCPACKAMKPLWNKITSELPTGTVYRAQNVQEEPTQEVERIPTIIRYYKDGTSERYEGGRDEDRLRTFLSA
jgi:thiol-disulfide isomerase/thioredoxin